MKKQLLFLFALFLIWNTANAQVIYENFNYTAGQDVGGTCTSGTCANNNWITIDGSATDGGLYTVGSGTLTYNGLLGAGGNKINIFGMVGTNVRDVLRPLTGLTGNVVYASFLLNVPASTGLNQTISDVNTFVHFGSGNANAGLSGAVLGRLSIKRNATTSYNLGVENNATGTPNYTTYATNLNFGQTYFIVLKYDNTNGATVAHTVSLWVNPGYSTFGGTEPTPDVTNNSGSNTTPGAMTSIVLRSTGQTPNAEFDELRVGTTWADVTPAGVLPVSLLSFDGYSSGNTHYLTWKTASEKNNAYFEIWKKTEAETEFRYAGKVLGSGDSDKINQYNFKDNQVISGNSYYQLRQFDVDGKMNIHQQLVVIKGNLSNQNLSVFGNHTQTFASVTVLNSQKAHFLIYNLNGQKVVESNVQLISGGNTIKLASQLGSGTYILTTEFDGKKYSVKFIQR